MENCHGSVPRLKKYVRRWQSESCTSLLIFRAFSRRQGSLEDDPRPGRPASARSNENVEKTRAIVMRITTWLLAERPKVGKEAARQILERDLPKRKICSRFVSYSLTAQQRKHRVKCSVCHPTYPPTRQVCHRQNFISSPRWNWP